MMNQQTNNNDDKLKQIELVVENKIRPYLQKHEGDIVIRGYDNNCLTIGLIGACKNCPSAQITMEEIVKSALNGLVDEVKVVNTIDEDLLNLAKSILNKSKK